MPARPADEGPVTAAAGTEDDGRTCLLAVEGSRLYAAAWTRLARDLDWTVSVCEPSALGPGLARRPVAHDLVLLSLSPADPDTFEIVRRLRATPGYRALPVVLATTATDAAHEARLHAQGVDAIVERSDPARVGETLRRLRAALGPRPRVACIEDSQVAGRRIHDLLAGHVPIVLDHHADPAEALAAHRAAPYDVVLLDWTFPGPLQGPGIADALGETGEPVIVVLSDAEGLQRLPAATAARIDVALPKRALDTFLPWVLEELVREIFHRRLRRAAPETAALARHPAV